MRAAMVTYEIRLDRLLYTLLLVLMVAMLALMNRAPDVVTQIRDAKHGSSDIVKNYPPAFHGMTGERGLKAPDDDALLLEAGEAELLPALPVRCETLIQQPDPVKSSFVLHKKTDSRGGDLFAVQTKTIDHLKLICDVIPECVGFNTNGWLKKGIGEKYSAKSNLYVKTNKGTEDVYLSSYIIEDIYGKQYTRMLKEFKIYIYDIKTGQNISTVQDYKYGVEKLFISLLEKSQFNTKDPEEADMFFIPARCTSYRKSVMSLVDGITKAQGVMKKIMSEVKSKPYWGRSLGSDHFYICAHDMGTDVAAKADRDLIKNAIALVNTADYEESTYTPHKDISLPPHPSHGKGGLADRGKGGLAINPNNRTTLAFFAGTLDRGRIRPTIQKRWSKDPDFRIFMGQMEQERYIHHLKTSTFCLCPRGNEAWSPRLMDALWFGCIPVIISDYYELPLASMISWKDIAVFVKEAEYDNLKDILRSIKPATLDSMQNKIKQVYAHLTWNDPPKPYDAFHSVLFQLWQRKNVIRY